MPQIVKDNINSKAIRLYRYLNAEAALKTIELDHSEWGESMS